MKNFLLLIFMLILFNATQAQWIPMTPVPHILSDVFFIDSNHGFLVGSDGSIYGTTDAGLTWSRKNTPTLEWMVSIHFINANFGIAVGNTGEILKTTDGGNNWSSRPSSTINYLACVSFCDELNGFIVGNVGTILHTLNGGETWSILNSGTTNELRSCANISPLLCFAVGWNGVILKTTTGGTSWTTLTSGTTNDLLGVSFLDSFTGMAVGSGGIILKTTNGGNTWMPQNSGSYTLRDVFMINANQAVACGTNGTILRTEDGGAHWITQPTGTVEMITSIFFTDVLHGVAVGTGGLILKTVNGGYIIRKLVLLVPSGGEEWLSGSEEQIKWNAEGIDKIKIELSTNGGHKWSAIANNVQAGTGIYSWEVIDKNSKKSIIRITDLENPDLTSQNETFFSILKKLKSEEIPVSKNLALLNETAGTYSISQNYPNPFNPVTTIKYELPDDGFVILNIYNSLGELISVPVNEEKKAGIYEITFKGSDLPSGIYLYKINCGNYTSVKKMLLLK